MRSPVIKAGDATRLSRGPANIDLRDIAERADAVLREAHEKAEAIIAEAFARGNDERKMIHQEAENAGREEGLVSGREAGHAQGLEEVRCQFGEDQAVLISALTDMLASFNSQREKFHVAARRDVVVLAIAIASRIVKKLTAIDGVACDAAVDACREAIDLVGSVTEVIVRVHPDDRSALDRLAKEIADTSATSRHIQILTDESIERGGVRVETADSEIDAGVTTRIERIADELVTDWQTRMKDIVPGMQS